VAVLVSVNVESSLWFAIFTWSGGEYIRHKILPSGTTQRCPLFFVSGLQAFDAGRFCSKDRTSPEFAEFWLRHFRTYCEKFMVKCNEGPPSFLRSYVAFTVKSLLGTETLEDLAIFVQHLESLQKINENLVPPLAAAVIQLGKYRVEDNQDVVVSGLTMSQQHTLFKSKLYNQFTSERLSHRLKAVAADHGIEPEVRLVVVRDLLKHTLNEAQKKSVEFVVIMLSPIDDAEKLTFLLGSQENFGFL